MCMHVDLLLHMYACHRHTNLEVAFRLTVHHCKLAQSSVKAERISFSAFAIG